MTYDFKQIEKKWQKKWEQKKIFQVKESKKKKFYICEFFPYPSGEGLHLGHGLNYTIGDIYARFKRMQGFNVLYPIGYDALGLPAENAAIKAKIHPANYTKKSVANFMKQQKAMGWSYDWSRLVNTSNPEYYKWDQWIFLQMLKRGIAYRKKAPVNWCPKCKGVLANEQVHNGKCWIHKVDVEIKHLEQWFLKITDYIDELIRDLNKLDWPERIKLMQKNWIGKSFGTEILFNINGEKWPIFTTRPDTIYGVTFMVISAQHTRLYDLVTKGQKKQIDDFLKKLKSVSEKSLHEKSEDKSSNSSKQSEDFSMKEGVFTGSYAINPINGNRIPIFAGNFVAADYGCGMVMAVPGHDQRDFEFAKKYNLPIKEVIKGGDISQRAYTGEGVLINSNKFDGLNSMEAIEKITNYLKGQRLGKKVVQYKLRDWLVSRQRYWGTPIPVVYCDKCGVVSIPEEDLPVKLPKSVKFGKGNPLMTNKKWLDIKCPKCKGKAKREIDTMDTFVNSSWYFFRYTDPRNKKEIFNKKKVGYWAPLDIYIGGAEHACMHLIYCRFYTKFLRDLGLLKFDEPAKKLFNQGMLHAADGQKMSKSLGNVINPIDVIKKVGADTLRLALMSFGSPDSDMNWDEKILAGSHKFLKRVFDYFSDFKKAKSSPRIESKLNKTVKEVTEYVSNFKHNLAIIKIRQLFDNFVDNSLDKGSAEKFLQILHIYCPYITEELWEKLGNKNFISLSDWPKADEKKINKKFDKEDEARSKLVSDIASILKIIKEKGKTKKEIRLSKKKAELKKNKIYVYVLPNELNLYDEKEVSKKTGKEVKIFSVASKEKYDPTNKSKNAKPGKPAIFLE